MLLGGLWHGAAWTFVIWGGYQGALLALERLFGGRRLNADWSLARTIGARAFWAARVLACFHFVCLGWIIFRCEDTSSLWPMVSSFMDVRGWFQMPPAQACQAAALISPLLVVDAVDFSTGREQSILRAPWILRALLYVLALYVFIVFGRFESNTFIYFQF